MKVAGVEVPGGAVRKPLQERSVRTFLRILEATTELLNEKRFEEISVAEIARRAGSSVGAFYARIKNKDALLDCLDELYAREMMSLTRSLADPARWRGASLEEILSGCVAGLIRYHRERRGLIRALVLRARVRMERRFSERTRRMNATASSLRSLLASRASRMPHPDPDRALAFGFTMILTALREYVLFPEGPAAMSPLSDDELRAELTRAWMAYLGTGSARRTGSPPGG